MAIRVTEKEVRTMSDLCSDISSGRFCAADSFPSNEKGVVYTDKHRAMTWNGDYASSQAFAYYFGAYMPFMSKATPEWLVMNDVYSSIETRPGVNQYFHMGNSDALAYRNRIKGG
jgi:hypothetical protein